MNRISGNPFQKPQNQNPPTKIQISKSRKQTKPLARPGKGTQLRALAASLTLILLQLDLQAQDGNAGIQAANTQVRSYFDSGTQLMYAVGAILALIGAVKVYQKWNAGDPDTSKVAAAWFGSCVFLVVVTIIIREFFGI